MHEITIQYAERYKQELRRHYYISPASYLHFIETFKTLLTNKRNSIQNMKKRYDSGVEKLLEAAESVKDMQLRLR